ncbi:MAG: hypothetical protein ABIW32_08700 [Terrimesophilobacter sp.]
MTTVAPYGSWSSPIAAASLVASGHSTSDATFVGTDPWWLEARPAEGGRLAVRRHDADGEVVDVLPAPWNARTRVHEYGGGAWAVADDGGLVFAEFSDQRLYRFDQGASEPTALTPADAGMRFADLQIVDGAVLAIRETHHDGDLTRDIVSVPLDGSAAMGGVPAHAGGIRSLVSSSRFLANPRVSPDGSQLAWISWDHPQMPWDGTELRVGALVNGVVEKFSTLMGGTTESVLQPEWINDESLYAISDRSGWWNLYRVSLDGTAGIDGSATALDPVSADVGGPLWQLGARWYVVLEDGRILHTRTRGTDVLATLDPATGDVEVLDLPLDGMNLNAVQGNRVLLNGRGAQVASGVRELNLDTRELTEVRLDVDELPPDEYLPRAEAMTFTGKRDVHAFVYRPRNPDFTPPDGELPPFIAVVHGGPTSHSPLAMRLNYAYFTSRGIGVIDVNYGGSTGYGR